MKKEFNFSKPRRAFCIYAQTFDTDGQFWRQPTVAFVLATDDEEVKEAALTEEARSHKDWTLVEEQTDERLLLFNGSTERFKKIFAVPTTIFETK